jgi:phosphoribosylformylglycinamidine synthase
MSARVAVLQLPGVNCEDETAHALARAGLESDVFRWTRSARELRDYQAYVLPGGFSYQDRVRAGALAAKDPLIEVLADEADRGKPVLGICNGAQVLVEAGLVPAGGAVELALARNRMPERAGYYARWVWVRAESSPCLFLRGASRGDRAAAAVAHGEGALRRAPRVAWPRSHGRDRCRFATRARWRGRARFPAIRTAPRVGRRGVQHARQRARA